MNEWGLSNRAVAEQLERFMTMRRGKPFSRARVWGRTKKGRARWECEIEMQYPDSKTGQPRMFPVAGGLNSSFYFPTKDQAIAKAVELQLRGVVYHWVEEKRG